MKRLLLLVTIFPIFLYSQKKATSITKKPSTAKQTEKLLPLNDKLTLSAIMYPTHWSLYYAYNTAAYRPRSNKEIISLIEDSLSANTLDATHKAFAGPVKKIFSDLSLFGSSLAQFIGSSTTWNFDVVKFGQDGGKILIIDGAVSDNIYNTLRSSAKQRASNILASNILPALKSLNHIDIPGIKYLALSFTYGSKDFSNDDIALNLEAEYLCGVFPVEEIKRFNSNTISQEELIEKSHFYLKDRDNQSANKIKLTIE